MKPAVAETSARIEGIETLVCAKTTGPPYEASQRPQPASRALKRVCGSNERDMTVLVAETSARIEGIETGFLNVGTEYAATVATNPARIEGIETSRH